MQTCSSGLGAEARARSASSKRVKPLRYATRHDTARHAQARHECRCRCHGRNCKISVKKRACGRRWHLFGAGDPGQKLLVRHLEQALEAGQVPPPTWRQGDWLAKPPRINVHFLDAAVVGPPQDALSARFGYQQPCRHRRCVARMALAAQALAFQNGRRCVLPYSIRCLHLPAR